MAFVIGPFYAMGAYVKGPDSCRALGGIRLQPVLGREGRQPEDSA